MVVNKLKEITENEDRECEVIPQTTNLSLEERLKIIANLVIDRIIEDQKNGKLHIKLPNENSHG